MPKIALHEASPAQLRWYAESVLNLPDIKMQHQAATLIAKIQAINPDLDEIDVPDGPLGEGRAVPQDLVEKLTNGQIAQDKRHFSNDPRVTVTFSEATDSTKSKLVQIAVDGDVVVAKRGQHVKLPYRHFLTNLNAIETVGRESGEEDAHGMPIMEFADRLSYPMESIIMPPMAEIKAWHELHGSRLSDKEKALLSVD